MKTRTKGLLGLFGLAALSTAVSAFVVRRRFPEYGGQDDPRFTVVACMGERRFSSVSDRLAAGTVIAYMGGARVDLTGATAVDGATFTITSVMGGVELIVPEAWRVEVAEHSTMGGLANLTDPDADSDGPVVIVDARLVMGGVIIREAGENDGG